MPTLHPQILNVIEAMRRAGLKPIEALSPDEARRQMEETAKSRKAEPLPVGRVEESAIPGSGRADSRPALLARGGRKRRAQDRAGNRLLPRRRSCDRQPRYA